MRFIILGSKGFIGNKISDYLKKKKFNFLKIENLTKNTQNLISSNDVIINCLGKNPKNNFNDQLKKLIKLLRIKCKNILWIQLSTPLIYDQNNISLKINEKTFENPFNEYARSKQDLDFFIKSKKNIYFNYLILRISTVYDEKMKSKLFYYLKIINKLKLSYLINNSGTVVNFISLNELLGYILELSKNNRSWNNIFLISQNIKLNDLLISINPKLRESKISYLLNKIFFFTFLIFKFSFKEKYLFFFNKNKIEIGKLKKFIKIKKLNFSQNEIIKFFKKI